MTGLGIGVAVYVIVSFFGSAIIYRVGTIGSSGAAVAWAFVWPVMIIAIPISWLWVKVAGVKVAGVKDEYR